MLPDDYVIPPIVSCLRFFQAFAKAREQFGLGRIYFFGGGSERKPRCAIHLGKFREAPTAGRPFHSKGIAYDFFGVEVSGRSERVNGFSARLSDGSEMSEWSVDDCAGFFGELALRGGERIFIVGELAFRNRPRSRILFRPKRSTGMHEKNFQL